MEIYMKDGKALKVGGQFVKPAGGQTGETWVWNKGVIAANDTKKYSISFESNGTSYSTITNGDTVVDTLLYDDTVVYGGRPVQSWKNEAYRIITFLESPSGDLLTFLQANATKQ